MVAQVDSGIVQLQEREPRSCLQCGPTRCKVVPHIVVVELNLRHVADCLAAHGQAEVVWLAEMRLVWSSQMRRTGLLLNDEGNS